MKRFSIFVSLVYIAVLCVPASAEELFRQEGIGSWYGPGFDGRPTASGETFDSSQFTAAHPDLPFGTVLLVTNKHNNRQVTVRVNDRGPFVASRIVDVSKAAAEHLDMIITGTAPVVIETLQNSYLVPVTPAMTPMVTPTAAPTYMEPPVYTQPVYPEPPAYAQPQPAYSSPVYAQPQPVYSTPAYPEPPVYAQPQPTYSNPAYPEPPVYTQPQPAYSNPAYTQPVYPETPPYTYTQALPPLPIVETYASDPSPSPQAMAELEAAPFAPEPAASVSMIAPQPARGVKLIPAIEPQAEKTYKLQIGSYKDPRSAVAAYEKLRKVGLGPSYERYGDYYRVILAGVRGAEIKSVSDKLDTVGFHEALIREDR